MFTIKAISNNNNIVKLYGMTELFDNMNYFITITKSNTFENFVNRYCIYVPFIENNNKININKIKYWKIEMVILKHSIDCDLDDDKYMIVFHKDISYDNFNYMYYGINLNIWIVINGMLNVK